MNFKEAKEEVLKIWGKLEKDTKDKNEAVWFAKSDIAGSYGVDEEWLGIKGDGSLVWAYASGCSCWDWDGEYQSQVEKEVKSFKLEHKHTPKEWEDKLIEFAENGFETVEFPNHSTY